MFAGDLVFNGHLPIIDGSLKGWLKDLDGARRHPGRAGDSWTRAARLSPGPQRLDDERRYFDTLTRDVKRALAQGDDMRAPRPIGRRRGA